MKITVERIFWNDEYTIGKLFIDGKYFCDTLEDPVRDLNKNGKFDNEEVKIPGKTAIPFGTYEVTLSVQSPRFKTSATYKFCNGYLPRLLNVPNFEGVLIHVGNTAKDTEGCLLVGKNSVKGMVSESKDTFVKLYDVLKSSKDKIFIEIK